MPCFPQTAAIARLIHLTLSFFNLQPVFVACCVLLALPRLVTGQPADDSRLPYRQQPIDYFGVETDNPVARLQERLDREEARLEFREDEGYLIALLKALDVPLSSQMLVFAKNSVNARLISPENPRALYFNDEVYVGWVPGAPALEISAIDPAKGAVFYTLKQQAGTAPRLVREESCLLCHASTNALSVPGHLLRSFLTDPEGNPERGISRVSHDTPFSNRWGGWYVTGDLGDTPHQGNLATAVDRREYERNPAGPGRHASLDSQLKGKKYPVLQSDVVAILVHDHQIHFHNLVTRINYEERLQRWTRMVPVSDQAVPPETVTATEEQLVRYLLFVDAPPLESPILGSSQFETEFSSKGTRDSKGRSLRKFDLETRLFKYRCSYLIESRAFAALPEAARLRIYRRMEEVLQAESPEAPYDRIPRAERHTVVEILKEIKADLPATWGRSPS
jgi:hypothetical protein